MNLYGLLEQVKLLQLNKLKKFMPTSENIWVKFQQRLSFLIAKYYYFFFK